MTNEEINVVLAQYIARREVYRKAEREWDTFYGAVSTALSRVRVGGITAAVDLLEAGFIIRLPTDTAPAPSDDGWVVWSGGACPVDPEAMVEYEMRDRKKAKTLGKRLSWRHLGDGTDPFDIISYRIDKL